MCERLYFLLNLKQISSFHEVNDKSILQEILKFAYFSIYERKRVFVEKLQALRMYG